MKKILSLMLLISSGLSFSSDNLVVIKENNAYVLQDFDSDQIINLDSLPDEEKDAEFELFANILKDVRPGEVVRLPDDGEDEVYKYVVSVGEYRDDSHSQADQAGGVSYPTAISE